jgi:hypothetical protein
VAEREVEDDFALKDFDATGEEPADGADEVLADLLSFDSVVVGVVAVLVVEELACRDVAGCGAAATGVAIGGDGGEEVVFPAASAAINASADVVVISLGEGREGEAAMLSAGAASAAAVPGLVVVVEAVGVVAGAAAKIALVDTLSEPDT